MSRSYLFATILLLSGWEVIHAQIENLVYKFPSYLRENGLDPSHIYTVPIEVHLGDIDAEFTNFQVKGHTTGEFIVANSQFQIPDETALGKLSLLVVMGNQNTVLQGTYNINGTLHPDIIVSGSGKWTANPLIFFIYHISYDGISLSNDGKYVDLKNAQTKAGGTSYPNPKYMMEGLSAGGYEESTIEYVMDPLLLSIFDNPNIPMPKQLMQYLEDEFEKTPIEDIYIQAST